MNAYREFARFYAKGQYYKYSKQMAEVLPDILEQFNVCPTTILDLACGEGTFIVEMAKKGFDVTGIDLSPQQMEFAQEKAEKENVYAEILIQDMRSFVLKKKFDLITCWYDSLNHLLTLEDLEKTFLSVHNALNNNGIFIFDVNTIYNLAVKWQQYPSTVEQDTSNLFEIHRSRYDVENNIATLHITGFIRENEENKWIRIDEEYKERWYTIEEIRQCLHNTSLQELALWGDIKERSKPVLNTKRLWFIVKRT